MTRPRIAIVIAVSVMLILAGARTVSAWGLQSACVGNAWALTNPEAETADTTAGDIPPGGIRPIPDNINTVTATWPGDRTPHTYTRPAGCTLKETPSTPPPNPEPRPTLPLPSTSSPSSVTTSTVSAAPPTTPTSADAAPPSVTQPKRSSTPSTSSNRPAAALPETGSTLLVAVVGGLCVVAGLGLRRAVRRT